MPFEQPTPITEKPIQKPKGEVRPIAKPLDMINRMAEVFYQKKDDSQLTVKDQLKQLVAPQHQKQKLSKSSKESPQLRVVR